MDAKRWRSAGLPGLLGHLIQDRRGGRPLDRRLRLYAVGCCRRAWPLIEPNPDSRLMLEAAERSGQGSARAGEVAKASGCGVARRLGGADAGSPAYYARFAAFLACTPVVYPNWLRLCDYLARAAGDRHTERRAQVALVRCLFGNPFRPVAADPAWRTPTALTIAEGVHAGRAFDRLPVLADALEDAGCDHPDLLAHLRGPGPHARGCWPVDLLLGRG